MTVGSEKIIFPILPHHLGSRAPDALADGQLRAFVGSTTRQKIAARESALDRAFGAGVDAMRAKAGALKRHTLDQLDHYLERFVVAAEAQGVVVHFADDADDAVQIGLQIAEAAGASTCVKTKSMVTEEIRLRQAFEGAGITTWETDLGEFILQLDDDVPSHIVTPMIHKDRAAVARAFARELGAEYTESPQALTEIARGYLRRAFADADMAVTGGNFLVAETGSLVLCMNEGNGRWCTAGPQTLLAVVGIEKVVPDMASLTLMLKLLARSSTGQPLTVYTHIIEGPRRAGERDGPQDVHIILLDNGRTKLLADPVAREALCCIRCGACLNICPVYRRVGGHAYGSVYPGPIGAVITPHLNGLSAYPDLALATSLCGACKEVCPVDIDLPHLLIDVRRRYVEAGLVSGPERRFYRLWAWVSRRWWRYGLASWVARKVLRGRAAAGYVGAEPGLPGIARAWTDGRDLQAPSRCDRGGDDGA